MQFKIDRRSVLKAGAALAASGGARVRAGQADTPFCRGVLRQGHPRGHDAHDHEGHRGRLHAGDALRRHAVKQGTELVALQRDNLEIGNISPQDISKQMPAWSVLTSAYTFRDANHVLAFFASDLGTQMKKEAEDQLKIKILGPTFFGTRQVGLKPKKKITTPADWPASSCGYRRVTRGSFSAARSARTRRRSRLPRRTPRCRPARSTARTTRCPT